ncbi:MAG TPA: FAD-dependent oxidoreductase [Acidimicrobiia bacterium]|nr:FAD-dependent oxidoreductase [Acidimicrobiia bacterium]
MRSEQISVAIVGGGIGGMSAALALHQKGLNVTVFEQAPELGEIGAGVVITPNGLRQLTRLGVGSALEEVWAPLGDGSVYCYKDGTPVARATVTDSSREFRQFGVHRHDLLMALAGPLPSDLVSTGHRCVGVIQSESGVTLSFDNGRSAEADLVIGADGIQSVLRAQVTEPSRPIHSGFVAYRGLIKTSRIPGLPNDIVKLWMGENQHFLTFPVRRGEMINYVGFLPAVDEVLESWSAPGDAQALAAAFRGWDPQLDELLAGLGDTYWWGLYDREPIEKWTQGRLTLLGDAAHPMLPHLGQGANQAIEDALVLGELLDGCGQTEVEARLKIYESIRRDRTRDVQLQSRLSGKWFDAADDIDARNAALANYVEFKLWLYDYDAVDAARETKNALAG